MSELQIIGTKQILNHNVRVYGDFENPLFLAKNVAEWIEHSNLTMMIQSVDEDEKVILTPTKDCLVGLQVNTPHTFLTENGLYEVLFLSRKPLAKQFKKEVKQLLHDLRTGKSIVPKTEAQILSEALVLAHKILDNANTQIAVKDQQIAELKPKADYADAILRCPDAITVTVIAKDYGMSAQRFNQVLHEQGIQFKQSDIWLLYQKYADKSYTKTETYPYQGSDGEDKVNTYTKWTQKGRMFLYYLLQEKGIRPLIEKEKESKIPRISNVEHNCNKINGVIYRRDLQRYEYAAIPKYERCDCEQIEAE